MWDRLNTQLYFVSLCVAGGKALLWVVPFPSWISRGLTVVWRTISCGNFFLGFFSLSFLSPSLKPGRKLDGLWSWKWAGQGVSRESLGKLKWNAAGWWLRWLLGGQMWTSHCSRSVREHLESMEPGAHEETSGSRLRSRASLSNGSLQRCQIVSSFSSGHRVKLLGMNLNMPKAGQPSFCEGQEE